MSFIYLAVYADNTCYVGQTINTFEELERRYQAYTKRPHHRPSEQACFALGMPALGVIEYCPPEKLDEREKYWIAQHAACSETLNLTGLHTKEPKGYNAAQRKLLKLEMYRWKKLRRMESKLAKQARRGR